MLIEEDNQTWWDVIHNLVISEILVRLGPGRPSAGGPRMDRRAVTSLGVVEISHLASRLRRSAWRGPEPTGCQERPLVQKRHVTHRLPVVTLWSKTVM